MNARNTEKWEKMRRKGKSNFILIKGGVIFGLLAMGIIFPALKFIYHFVGAGYTLSFFDTNYQSKIIFGLVEWFALGCLWGWLVWSASERSYLREQQQQPRGE